MHQNAKNHHSFCNSLSFLLGTNSWYLSLPSLFNPYKMDAFLFWTELFWQTHFVTHNPFNSSNIKMESPTEFLKGERVL